jgi:hypothetical protein
MQILYNMKQTNGHEWIYSRTETKIYRKDNKFYMQDNKKKKKQ